MPHTLQEELREPQEEERKPIGTLGEVDQGLLGKLGDFAEREWEAIKSPSAWLKGFRDVGESVLGVGEAAMSVASGVPGFLAGLAGQTAGGVKNVLGMALGTPMRPAEYVGAGPEEIAGAFGESEDVKERISSLLAYIPKTEQGVLYSQIALAPVGVYMEGVNKLAEMVSDDPDTQAGVRFAGDIALVFGLPALKGYIKSSLKSGGKPSIKTMNKMVQQADKIPAEVKTMMEEYVVDKDMIMWEEAGEAKWVPIKKAKAEQIEIHKEAEPAYAKTMRGIMEDLKKPLVEKVTKEPVITTELPGEVAVKLAEKQLLAPELPEGKVAAGSLAYGMDLPKYAENINLDRVGADYPVRKLILDVSDTYADLIQKKRMSGISHEETMALADSLGLSSDSLVRATQRKTGKLSAYITAARDVLVTSATKLHKLAQEYGTNPTEENRARFNHSFQNHAAWQADVGGASSEIGRALGAHKITSRDKGYITSKLYEQIMRRAGKKGLNAEQIRRLATLDPSDPYAINKFLREIAEVRFGDKLYEAWINSLLFSFQTNIVNTGSNIAMALDKLATTTTAAALEAPKVLVGKERNIYFGEIPSTFKGMWHGLRVGAERMAFAWEHEMTMRGGTKIETRVPTAIGGRLGRTTRIPGRLLISTDEFAKGVIETGDIFAKAYRRAVKDGKKGHAEIAARAGEIINNLDKYPEIQKGAIDEAMRRTFVEELGPYGKKIGQIRSTVPGVRWILPFLKVSINIPKQAFYRSPLNFGRILWKLKKGELKGAELSEQVGQATMGTALAMATFMHALEGNIVGSAPVAPSERETFRRTKQEYSLRLGDKWISFERLEPMGTLLGAVADLAQAWKYLNDDEQQKMAQSLAQMFTENLINKTFMRGMWTFSKAVADPERYGEYFIQSFAGSVIPTEVAKIARYTDPFQRDVRNLVDHVQSRIPGLRQQLEPKVDVWGKRKEDEGPLAYRALSPFWMKEDKTGGLLESELERLEIFISPMSRRIGEEKMEPSDYTRMVMEIGPHTKSILQGFVSQPEYQYMTDPARKRAIETLIRTVRQSGRTKYKIEYMRK